MQWVLFYILVTTSCAIKSEYFTGVMFTLFRSESLLYIKPVVVSGAVQRWILSQSEKAAITATTEHLAGIRTGFRQHKEGDKTRCVLGINVCFDQCISLGVLFFSFSNIH